MRTTHSQPTLLLSAYWWGAGASSASFMTCFEMVLATSRLRMSPTTMPRTPPSGLLNATIRPILIPSNAPCGNFPCASAVTNKARATHDHSQEWVANDRWSCLKGRLPRPSWTISHTARTTLRPIRNVQHELPELFRTNSLEEGEGASLDHAGPEASPLCQAPSERLPMPVASRQLSQLHVPKSPLSPATQLILLVADCAFKCDNSRLASTSCAHSPMPKAAKRSCNVLFGT